MQSVIWAGGRASSHPHTRTRDRNIVQLLPPSKTSPASRAKRERRTLSEICGYRFYIHFNIAGKRINCVTRHMSIARPHSRSQSERALLHFSCFTSESKLFNQPTWNITVILHERYNFLAKNINTEYISKGIDYRTNFACKKKKNI